MANVVTDAETNVIKKAQMAKVRELDFAQLFGENVQNLLKTDRRRSGRRADCAGQGKPLFMNDGHHGIPYR